MSIEIWKPIHGFEELYEVSNLGNVRSKDHSTLVCRYCNGIPKVFVKTHLGRDIKCSISSRGHKFVTLRNGSVKKIFGVS